ncbi:MAG: YHS domain-containing (seleno)protein [Paracoccus sp. (in: a-proteobacteria)]|nr:YHS domain-containing (seleno)protein [Paracoccus sp. (in: a-proteobacteria)]
MFRPFLLCLALATPAHADVWAMGGYDPVAMMADDEAAAGRPDVVTNWQGKQWHFNSVENRAAFEANPRAYAPGLDGYCVVALAEGRLEPGDPRYFVLIGNRIYFLGSPQRRTQIMDNPRELLMRARDNFAQLSR